jgi:hypothetical protein
MSDDSRVPFKKERGKLTWNLATRPVISDEHVQVRRRLHVLQRDP